jgi:hypothetical protein
MGERAHTKPKSTPEMRNFSPNSPRKLLIAKQIWLPEANEFRQSREFQAKTSRIRSGAQNLWSFCD